MAQMDNEQVLIVRALFERIEIGPGVLTFIPRAVHADLFRK